MSQTEGGGIINPSPPVYNGGGMTACISED